MPVGPDRAVMLADTKRQAGKLIVHAFVHVTRRDMLRRGRRQKAWDDFMPHVCRGQRGDRRLSEMGETHVVWLILGCQHAGAASKSPGQGQIRGWRAECTFPPLQHQA